MCRGGQDWQPGNCAESEERKGRLEDSVGVVAWELVGYVCDGDVAAGEKETDQEGDHAQFRRGVCALIGNGDRN